MPEKLTEFTEFPGLPFLVTGVVAGVTRLLVDPTARGAWVRTIVAALPVAYFVGPACEGLLWSPGADSALTYLAAFVSSDLLAGALTLAFKFRSHPGEVINTLRGSKK